MKIIEPRRTGDVFGGCNGADRGLLRGGCPQRAAQFAHACHAARELREPLLHAQQLAERREALRHDGRQVAHVGHQTPLDVRAGEVA